MRRLADLLRDHQSELAEAERAEIGCPLADAVSMVSSADYFDMYAGMASCLAWRDPRTWAPAATLYVSGALRRHRRDHAVECAAEPGRSCFGTGAGGRQRRGHQAVGADLLHHPPPRFVHGGGGFPSGHRERRDRHRRRGRRAPRAPPRVGKITFTGSVATGRRIVALAGERILPLTLELGGKSANIVFADVDVAKVAASIVRGSISHVAGQACSTLSRLLVERSLHDELVERVVAGFAELVPGETLPPMITEAQYDKVLELLRHRRGGRRHVRRREVTPSPVRRAGVATCRPPSTRGWTNDMRIAREEVFGPVLCVIPFDDEAEAIAIANDTPYGLVGAVLDQRRRPGAAGGGAPRGWSGGGERRSDGHAVRRLQGVRLRTGEGLRGAAAVHAPQDRQHLDGQLDAAFSRAGRMASMNRVRVLGHWEVAEAVHQLEGRSRNLLVRLDRGRHGRGGRRC